MSVPVVESIEGRVRTNLAAAARETDAVVTDVSRVHDAALSPLGDSTCGNLDFGMSTNILVEDLGAVKHGFKSNAVGL
jgi:hypothetical protein